MSQPTLPLLVEPEQLEPHLDNLKLRVVDLSKPSVHLELHVPGAVPLEYNRVVTSQPPLGGALPEDGPFSQAVSELGIDADTHVVAYDDEGGGKAARFLWTLALGGHQHFSLLNGGLHAWANERHRFSRDAITVNATQYPLTLDRQSAYLAELDYVRNQLDNDAVRLLDVRSPAEYSGEKRFANRGGHIPGAVNLEWTEMMDQSRNLRLKPKEQLLAMLADIGIHKEDEVIVYCQTHHRSAHSWFVLYWLGFNVRGYVGSWSEWGNREDTPIE